MKQYIVSSRGSVLLDTILDGEPCKLEFTKHAIERMVERNVSPEGIAMVLADAAESILFSKAGDKSAVRDVNRDFSLYLTMEGSFDGQIEIKIHTFIHEWYSSLHEDERQIVLDGKSVYEFDSVIEFKLFALKKIQAGA